MEKKLELLDLPIEIICEIIRELDCKSITRFCQISRSHRELRRNPLISNIIFNKRRGETLVGKVKRTITQFKDKSLIEYSEFDEVFFFFNNSFTHQSSTLNFYIDRTVREWLPDIFHLVDDLKPGQCLIEQHHEELMKMKTTHNLPYGWGAILLNEKLGWGLCESSDKDTAVLVVLRTASQGDRLNFRLGMPLFRDLMRLYMEVTEESFPMVAKLYADGSKKKKEKEIGIIEVIYDNESSEG